MCMGDKRIVMTLDAGGTNFVFSAIRDNEEIVRPITLPAVVDDIELCLQTLLDGFRRVQAALLEKAVAISFAFPGPADYVHGIIGDLPNFPAFRGGVALGPYLQEQFQIPVYINNDGNLFVYGEALAGILPEINRQLEVSGSSKRYKNLIGVTLGTGFGAGVVIDGNLVIGDNGAGGDVWCFRNKKYPGYIVEESVSIRAVKRVYHELSDSSDEALAPKDIYEIAEGIRQGNRLAAIRSFEELGEMAGNALAEMVTMVDGLIVIGGGLSGASTYILPALMREMKESLQMMDGSRFPRLQMDLFNLDDPEGKKVFLRGTHSQIRVPGTNRWVTYDPCKRIGIAISKLGAARAISLGAYQYALNQLDK